MSSLKDDILSLRKQGYLYLEIARQLGCAKSTISYYLNDKTKQKVATRNFKNRKKAVDELKRIHGGKCKLCGYDKSLSALDFHHRDPKQKKFTISNYRFNFKLIAEEAEKCDLICANCHRELHTR